MPTPLQSPFPNTLPFLQTIPAKYWKQGIVPQGELLITGSPPVESEYLFMMAYSPNPGTVSYTGTSIYPQFSEWALGPQYAWQCVAFTKAVADKRNMATDAWKPWMSLIDFSKMMESYLPSDIVWLVIACFDGKPSYALADANKKHVAILLDIVRHANGKPKEIVVVDQNYYSYAPYSQYKWRIAKHRIPWGLVGQKWVGFARNYHIVNI